MSDVEIAVLGLASAILVFLAAVLTFLPALGDFRDMFQKVCLI